MTISPSRDGLDADRLDELARLLPAGYGGARGSILDQLGPADAQHTERARFGGPSC